MWEVLLGKALGAGASVLGSKLAERLLHKVPLVGSFKSVEIKEAFKQHFETVYQKCFYLKTILGDQRLEFAKLYAGQTFEGDDNEYNQNELVDFIIDGNSTLIQGTGGSGKSMFLKVLWLHVFGVGERYLPIFFELRALNKTNVSNLEDYIFHSCVGDTKNFTRSDFSASMQTGAFLLIIDGFDEIEIERRDTVQLEIIRLKELYPKLVIVMTSRPDERFSGWHQFSTIRVKPLTKLECLGVIDKAPYDTDEKTRLSKKVEDDLFNTHESFLSNPLLVYMTLVTYSYNPNFSDQMHEFYEQAFDALYYRHDLAKGGGFKREYHTGLSRTDLRRLISIFCFRTYFEQTTEFLNSDLLDFVNKSKKLYKEQFGNVNEESFVKDLEENLCFLKRDGINIEFTHRKLQEYFAAYCISNVTIRNLENIFEKFSFRVWDEVISLCFDLNPDLVREKYIMPFHDRHAKFFNLKNAASITKNFCKISGIYIRISYSEQKTHTIHILDENGHLEEIRSNFMIWPAYSDGFGTFISNLRNFRKGQKHFGEDSNSGKFSDLITVIQESQIAKPNDVVNGVLKFDDGRLFLHYTINENFNGRFRNGSTELENVEKIEILEWEKKSIFNELKSIAMHFFETVNSEVDNYNEISIEFDGLTEEE